MVSRPIEGSAMIDEADGERTFVCDGCGSRAEFDNGVDFRSAWYSLADQGWVAFKDRYGEWSHYCRDCARRRASGVAILDQPARAR